MSETEDTRRLTIIELNKQRRMWVKRARSGHPAKRWIAKGSIRVIDQALRNLGVKP